LVLERATERKSSDMLLVGAIGLLGVALIIALWAVYYASTSPELLWPLALFTLLFRFISPLIFVRVIIKWKNSEVLLSNSTGRIFSEAFPGVAMVMGTFILLSPYLTLGNSENLEVGEWVMAIGSPFGLSHTVTVGVVSALGRSINAGPYDEFIQTDASINPGNSGGPLINIEGEVIGINTAIISGNSGGNVGIGFAIPINIAKGILKDLKEKGSVTRGWLGVMIQKITPELAKSFGLNQSEGALVGDVIPGGPAFKGGVKRGDVIVRFDGKDVKDMEDLPKIVAATTPNSVVNVEIVREGSPKTLSIKIETLTDTQPTVVAKADPLGMQLQDITPELAKSLKLEGNQGVLVSDVTPGNSAAESGIRRGDVISEMNRTPITNMKDYQRLAGSVKTGDSVLFLVKRGGTTIYIAVKVG